MKGDSMKNLVLAFLLTTGIIMLCGMQKPNNVTSISFDGGKTELRGNVVVKINIWTPQGYQAVTPAMTPSPDGSSIELYFGSGWVPLGTPTLTNK